MFSLSFLSFPDTFSIHLGKIEEIAQYIAETVPLSQKGIVHIAFISDEEMRVYNRDYRGIDATTDVLSFHYFDDFSDIQEDDIAGECLFSEAKIIAQAGERGHTCQEEFEILCIHSLLHLLGFDHEDDSDFEDMWRYESAIRRHF